MYNDSNGSVGGSAKWMLFAPPPLSHGSVALLAPVRAAETWHTHQAGVVTQEHTAQALLQAQIHARQESARAAHTHRQTGWPARCDARPSRRAKTAADPVAVATRANRARHLSACVHVSTHTGACVCVYSLTGSWKMVLRCWILPLGTRESFFSSSSSSGSAGTDDGVDALLCLEWSGVEWSGALCGCAECRGQQGEAWPRGLCPVLLCDWWGGRWVEVGGGWGGGAMWTINAPHGTELSALSAAALSLTLSVCVYVRLSLCVLWLPVGVCICPLQRHFCTLHLQGETQSKCQSLGRISIKHLASSAQKFLPLVF